MKEAKEEKRSKDIYDISCPGCGKFIKKIKKQKETVKHSFECPSCTSKFSITFPGTDAEMDNWLRDERDERDEDDEFTYFKLR